MKKHIPNTLTLLNLFSGCCGIIACINGEYKTIPIYICISLVADFLDGFVARLLNVKSELGGQLDSLADMVTFGVLPAIMMMTLAFDVFHFDNIWIPKIALIIALFAALRLAKFNIDTRQTVNFIGLNTPSSTIFVLGYFMYYFYLKNMIVEEKFSHPFYSIYAILIISVILSVLMVSEISIFSMKGNPFSWKQNKFRVLFLATCIPQIVVLKWLGLSTIIVSYILFALLDNKFSKTIV